MLLFCSVLATRGWEGLLVPVTWGDQITDAITDAEYEGR